MCCLVTLLVVLGPRAVILFWWLTDQVRWALTFDNQILLPLLGFLFLPWTTLMYVLVWSVGGLEGFDWALIAFALVTDLATYGGGVFTNRDRLPGSGQAA